MASAHIFTVNTTTFNTHLNYMFAGTGAGRQGEGLVEQKGALADILGVRAGDDIMFYVAGRGFYGFFKAEQLGSRLVFYEAPENQYLDDELGGKTLTYRLFISASEYGVYRFGVDEWDAIENPENIEDRMVMKMQWSWIFKKLKGGRGCTAIPKQEFDLLRKIVASNNDKLEESSCYKFVGGEIHPSDNRWEYCGDTNVSPILSGNVRIIGEEADLRILFTARAGIDGILDEILKPTEYGRVTYVSNETKCSFGMKSIDLLFLTDQDKCLLVELKNNFAHIERPDSVVEQIGGYSRWVASYKPQLKEIIPILILREARAYPARRGGKNFKYLSEADCRNNNVSLWYREKLSQIQYGKEKLREYSVDNVNELEVYQFHVDDSSVLQSFNPL